MTLNGAKKMRSMKFPRKAQLVMLFVLALDVCMACTSISSQQQSKCSYAACEISNICATLEVGMGLSVLEYNSVVDSSQVANAYCKQDGTIVICEGMMKLFESEDELAAVVAHEMGHLVAKHKGRQTPENEMEADRIGLELMAKAGYDPNAAVRFWTRYYEHIGWWEGDGTHQEPHERIEMLGRLASEYRGRIDNSKQQGVVK